MSVKKCAISKEDKDLPVTGLGIAEVDAYLAWLSERTGKVYRLPTSAEWSYAASAAGKQPKKRLQLQGRFSGKKVLKGDWPYQRQVRATETAGA